MDFNASIESQRFNNTSFISELQQHIPQHFNETSAEENENNTDIWQLFISEVQMNPILWNIYFLFCPSFSSNPE